MFQVLRKHALDWKTQKNLNSQEKKKQSKDSRPDMTPMLGLRETSGSWNPVSVSEEKLRRDEREGGRFLQRNRK